MELRSEPGICHCLAVMARISASRSPQARPRWLTSEAITPKRNKATCSRSVSSMTAFSFLLIAPLMVAVRCPGCHRKDAVGRVSEEGDLPVGERMGGHEDVSHEQRGHPQAAALNVSLPLVAFPHQYCCRWRLIEASQWPLRVFSGRLTRMASRVAQNPRQWLSGRTVITARQSGHRQRFSHCGSARPSKNRATYPCPPDPMALATQAARRSLPAVLFLRVQEAV